MAFLDKKVPYKYVIYSTSVSNCMWEYIYDLRDHGTFNRCLELNQSSSDRKFSYFIMINIKYVYMYLLLSVERLFHIYDGFVFPQVNWWVRIQNYLSVTGIDTKESHGYALMIFLKTVHMDISGFDITRAFENVRKIYLHLKQKKYLHYTAPTRYTNFYCTEQLNRGLCQVLCVYVTNTVIKIITIIKNIING